ncbi:MAG: choice-of-anchor D domain-containing protein, partial [Deltaproteobacteria bacterium]|nr:choice-of-anchor D domain-containing protein [Deltaproteobacteria bacterium]
INIFERGERPVKKIFMLVMVFGLSLSHSTWGEVFQVDDVGSFQAALTTAQSNGEEDTINIASGDFNISSTLTYTIGENFALTIVGEGPGTTNLVGADLYQIFKIQIASGVTDYNAHITIQSITLKDGNTTGNGGALSVFTNTAAVTIDNVEFLNNTASYGGAAYIIATYGNVYFYNSRFIGNESSNYYGGAVLGSMTGNVVLDRNLFQANIAANYSGVYVVAYSGDITFTRNTFIENSATQLGGGFGLDASVGHILFTNNIISGNSANDLGGGIISTDTGVLSVINNTFYRNTAQNDKGGLHLDLGSGEATADIYNNIIWGNVSSVVGDLYMSDLSAMINLYNNNLVDYLVVDGTNFVEEDNINEDPSLDIDFALLTGSPCIDAGENNAPEIPLLDLEGNDRIIDGDLDGTAYVDIGAHEYAVQDISVNPVSIDFGDVGVGDGSVTSSLTIENIGTADLLVSDITIAGNDATDFAIDLNRGSDDAIEIPGSISPGESVTLVVIFSPSSMGDKYATLEISSDDPDEDVVNVTLIGTGAGGQDIAADPAKVDFGEINTGESSKAKRVTIENQGGGNLNISSIMVKGDNADEFSIDFDNGSDPINENSVIIPAGGAVTLAIVFSPASSGEKKASLEILSDDPDEEVVMVSLKGNGKEDKGGCYLSSAKKKNKK